MLTIDDSTDHNATPARLRFLEPGVGLRLSDLRDALGGYACNIVEVRDGTIWIDLPIRRDRMLDLELGQLVCARLDRPGDAVYLFDTVVSEQRPDDDSPFGLKLPVHIDRRPHRSETRLAMVLDATYDVDGDRTARAKVVDLSAGGLGLICSDELQPEALVTIHCRVPGPERELSIDQPAVVRSRTIYGKTPSGSVLHQYGLEFLGGDDRLREEIMSSVIWNLTQNPAVL